MDPHICGTIEVYIALGYSDLAGIVPGQVKIGISGRAHARVKGLRHENGNRPVRMLASMHGTECDEHFIHGLFARHHVRYEWFRPAPDLLAFAERLAAEGRPFFERVRDAALTEAAARIAEGNAA
jgi:hypothetical protein